MAEARPDQGPFAWLSLRWILLLALAVRLVLAVQMGNRYYFGDTAEFEAAARSILAGHGPGPEFPRAPFYPAFMALAFLIGGPGNFIVTRLLQLVFGVGTVWLVARLGRRIGAPEGGRLAALCAAVAPTLVFSSCMLYATSPYTFFLLATVVTAVAFDRRPGTARALWLGVLMALVTFTDQVGLVPLAAVGLWLLAGIRGGGRGRLGRIVLAFAVALLLGLPYMFWHASTYGRTNVFMAKAQYVLWAVRSKPDLAGERAIQDSSKVFQPLGAEGFARRELGLLRQRPGAYLSDYGREFVHFFDPMPDRIQTRNTYSRGPFKLAAALFFVPVLLLSLLGLARGAASWRHRILLAAVPLSTAALYALFFTQTRYRVPVEPPIMVLAALGLLSLLPRPGPASVRGTVAGPSGPASDDR